MTRLLAPYLWPLVAALTSALMAACGWIYLQSGWLADAEAERDALRGRIENINISREIDDAIRSLDDADFGADIDGRLSGDDD